MAIRLDLAEWHTPEVQSFAPSLISRKPAFGWLENASISAAGFNSRKAVAALLVLPGSAATPPGSGAPAASGSPLWDEPDPLAFVAFVGGKPQAYQQFGGGAGAAILLALLTHKQQHPRAARLVVDGALAGGGGVGAEHAIAAGCDDLLRSSRPLRSRRDFSGRARAGSGSAMRGVRGHR